jgi:hypothetical protein
MIELPRRSVAPPRRDRPATCRRSRLRSTLQRHAFLVRRLEQERRLAQHTQAEVLGERQDVGQRDRLSGMEQAHGEAVRRHAGAPPEAHAELGAADRRPQRFDIGHRLASPRSFRDRPAGTSRASAVRPGGPAARRRAGRSRRLPRRPARAPSRRDRALGCPACGASACRAPGRAATRCYRSR